MSEPAGASTAVTTTHSVEVPADLRDSLEALAEVANAWGADWQPEGEPGHGTGGRLIMPVLAGIRRGVAAGRIQSHPQGASTRLVYAVEHLDLHLNHASVGVLLLAAMGGLLTVVWPFFPQLLPVAPFGALLALGGWFLVVSQLQNSGPRELLDLVAEQFAAPPESGEPEAAPAETGEDLEQPGADRFGSPPADRS